MSINTLTVEDIKAGLNLSDSFVKKLIKDGRISPISNDSNQLLFSETEISRLADDLKNQRLASLTAIARASEEAGLYELDEMPPSRVAPKVK